MEIERINENTVKFYISYMDIEDRGFDKEDVWYNREKSEQLFWEMMDEINEQEDFMIDGPLWIQVQALDKGLEIIVTKAQLSRDGQKLELPNEDGKILDMSIDDKMDSYFTKNNDLKNQEMDQDYDDIYDDDDEFAIVLRFKDIEDVIQLSHASTSYTFAFDSQLFAYESSYYLFIKFKANILDDDEQEDVLSHMLEYSEESNITIHRLQEYGKLILSSNALQQLRHYFSCR